MIVDIRIVVAQILFNRVFENGALWIIGAETLWSDIQHFIATSLFLGRLMGI